MAGFDFDAAVRWARLDPKRTLARRADAELPFVSEDRIGGGALLLDTCVYIDQMQNRSPELVGALIAARPTNHSTVAVQELMHTVGVLDPDDPRSRAAVAAIRRLVVAMPPHRMFTPDADVLGHAALLSGILCRLQGYADHWLDHWLDTGAEGMRLTYRPRKRGHGGNLKHDRTKHD